MDLSLTSCILLLAFYFSTVVDASGKTMNQRDDVPGIPSATFEAKVVSGRMIAGVAVANDNMYVIRMNGIGGINNIEVYDLATGSWTTNLTMNFQHAESMALSTSCNRLYVLEKDTNWIHTLDISGSTPAQSSFKACLARSRVSIGSDGCNVIVPCQDDNTIVEYTPEGSVVRTIKLAKDGPLRYVWQAVELPSGRFVVGGVYKSDYTGICIIDVQPEESEAGEIDEINFIGTVVNCENDKEVIYPHYFVVDRKGYVIVSLIQSKKEKVVLLDPSLKYVKNFISHEAFAPNYTPESMFLDEENSRLYLDVDHYYPGGEVRVYNVAYE